jgi:hypothetical protein
MPTAEGTYDGPGAARVLQPSVAEMPLSQRRPRAPIPAPRTAAPPGVLLDAHVHFHPGFDRGAFLDAALANLGRGAAELGLPGAARCLLLAERRGEHWFEELAAGGAGEVEGWSLWPTAEPEALVAQRGGERLVLVAGRQVAAREGVEALALGTLAGDLELRDGLPLDEVLARAAARGALLVLPWGFGKWWGGRGRLVRAALAGFADFVPLFLGDSATRPRLAPAPRLFREAAARGVAILPGTDPLPFPSEVGRAGSYGAALAGGFDLARPLASLRALLAAGGPHRTFRRFGRRAGWGEFALSQARMQALRRRPPRGAEGPRWRA